MESLKTFTQQWICQIEQKTVTQMYYLVCKIFSFFKNYYRETFLFIHILAEKTRVKLREKEGETSDYINANYIGVHIFY